MSSSLTNEHVRKTTVWLGKWTAPEEGTLSLTHGELSFVGTKGTRFCCPLIKTDRIVWHWYSFGCAFEILIGGVSYFVSFMPLHAGLESWMSAHREGCYWRALLEGRDLPARTPIGPRLFVSFIALIQAFFYGVGGILVMMQVVDETNATWMRAGSGVIVLCLIYMVIYLLWKAVVTPFRHDD